VVVDSIDVNDSSGSKANVALIHNLYQAGFDLKVYHYSQNKIQLTGIECVSIPENKLSVMYVLSRMQRIFTRFTKFNINPFIEKLLGFSFTFFNDVNSIKKALKTEKDFEPNWLLTLSKASSFRPHGALLNIPKWHFKWLAYIHDPYPMHFYPRPYNWVEPGHHQKQEFFREISKKSAHAVFPSKLLQEWMGSYYSDFLDRGIVIPHQISENENLLSPLELPYLKEGRFTVLHAGSLMKPRNPRGLLEGFQDFLFKIPDAKENVQLLFIGRQDYHIKYLKEQAEIFPQLYINNSNVDFKEVNSLQVHVSVNVILEAKAEISPFLPGKFPHCIQAKRPILYLGPDKSETLRLLGINYPYTAEIDDAQAISIHLQNLYGLWLQNKKEIAVDYIILKDYLGINNLKKIISNLNH